MSSIFAAPLKIGDGNLLALLAPMSWLVPELAQYSDAPRLARFFHRVQRQRFIDSGHNFEWHQRSMRTSFRSLAQRAARRYGVPLSLVMGVMRQESAFSSKAESSAGALGLMQIMPLTGTISRAGSDE